MSRSPWLDDGDVQLYHGDVITTLQSLPAGIVQTVVTSPPYWGLRDYGTGQWDGGDPDCDHLGEPFRTKATINANCGTGADVKNAVEPAADRARRARSVVLVVSTTNSASKPPPPNTSSGSSPCSAKCGASSATTAPSG